MDVIVPILPPKRTKKGKKKNNGCILAPPPIPFHDDPFAALNQALISCGPGSDTHVPLDESEAWSFGELSDDEATQHKDSAGEPVLVKRMYQGRRKCQCCINWVERKPRTSAQRQKPNAEEDHKGTAVLLRHNTVRVDDSFTFPLESVVVKSQPLKDILAKVLEDYPGINIGRKDATFYPPFEPLVHVWEQLKNCIASSDDKTTQEHGLAFYEAVEPEVLDAINDRDHLIKRGVMTFQLLWSLYQPGDLVVCSVGGKKHLMRVKTISSLDEIIFKSKRQYSINLECLAWSGNQFEKTDWQVQQSDFKGSKPITELEAIPFKLHPNGEDLFTELVQRGRKTYDVILAKDCKDYRGFISRGVSSRSVIQLGTGKKWVEGRIVIDPAQFARASFDDIYNDIIPAERDAEQLTLTTKSEYSDEEIAMCRSTVRGFCLTTRSFAEFEVDGISDTTWNDKAFDKLVMPGKRKRLIKALVEMSQKNAGGFDDFIKGKGQGFVMLLMGPPGTGKTLTAESIAETVHRPLYAVSAEEFSKKSAHSIEAALSDVLKRAAQWNAVLLIDEADLFMEKRDPLNHGTSASVAAFLRLLEYYKGVLILTTNRSMQYDKAFCSRIHLTLKFGELDAPARTSIWKNFLRLIPNNIHEPDVTMLSSLQLNGRQVKNVVKMSHLFAKSQGQILAMDHIEDVLDVMELDSQSEDDVDSSDNDGRRDEGSSSCIIDDEYDTEDDI